MPTDVSDSEEQGVLSSDLNGDVKPTPANSAWLSYAYGINNFSLCLKNSVKSHMFSAALQAEF